MKKRIGTNEGITLIALVVTIIVMVILATVTINLLLGDNGIINSAKQAKFEYTKSSIKEQIDLSVVGSLDNVGRIIKPNLLEKLQKLPEGKEILERDEFIYVVYPEYTFEIDLGLGKVGEIEGEINKDKTPGELEGSGTKENPYLIESIEDLVFISNEVSRENRYSYKYFKLVYTLDFNSSLSYCNPKTKVVEKEERIITESEEGIELKTYMTTGKGFNPIGGNSKTKSFAGYFDGNKKEIRNLYINRPEEDLVALFGYKAGGDITNLGVTGTVTGRNQVGGMVGGTLNSGSPYNIENCYNKCSVTGKNQVGGIAGNPLGLDKIKASYNAGTVVGEISVGGIIGYGYSIKFVEACYNIGKVKGISNVAGIVGGLSPKNIINCYNLGRIEGEKYVGGIEGYNTDNIEQCYNIGEIYGKESTGGLIGVHNSSSQSVGILKKSVNIGKVNSERNNWHRRIDWVLV